MKRLVKCCYLENISFWSTQIEKIANINISRYENKKCDLKIKLTQKSFQSRYCFRDS